MQFLVDNCIGVKAFAELKEEEINDPGLGFSFGGKKVLKKVLAQVKVLKNLIRSDDQVNMDECTIISGIWIAKHYQYTSNTQQSESRIHHVINRDSHCCIWYIWYRKE